MISQSKCERPAEIHKQIVAVYCKVMDNQILTKKCHEYSEGNERLVVMAKKKVWPSLISEELQEIDRSIREIDA
jgi:hypothetical protein